MRIPFAINRFCAVLRGILIFLCSSALWLILGIDAYAQQNTSVGFFATADPQYGLPENGWDDASTSTIKELNRRMAENPQYLGVVVAGDITENSLLSELNSYRQAIAAFSNKYYDGIGNHDKVPSNVENWTKSEQPCARAIYKHVIRKRDRPLTMDVDRKSPELFWRERCAYFPDQGNDLVPGTKKRLVELWKPYYSWDWHGVHFINLGDITSKDETTMLEANDKVKLDGSWFGSHYGSLDFLRRELDRLGGKPVVLIQHHCTDKGIGKHSNLCGVPEDLIEIIRGRNVVALITGHAHWVDKWHGVLDIGHRQLPTFIVGAAGYTRFVEFNIEIRDCEITVTTHRWRGFGTSDKNPEAATFRFPVNSDCRRPIDWNWPPWLVTALGN